MTFPELLKDDPTFKTDLISYLKAWREEGEEGAYKKIDEAIKLVENEELDSSEEAMKTVAECYFFKSEEGRELAARMVSEELILKHHGGEEFFERFK